MIFKYPEFLWASILVMIPIIIHLFNFKKYKVIYFSNVKLLKDIKLQTQSTSRIKHVLVLLSRIGFILSLVLLFAQPYIPNDLNEESQTKLILLDNSYSMNQVNQDGRLLDNAKRFALELIDKQDETSKMYFVSNELKPSNSHYFYKEDLKELVSDIQDEEKRYSLNFLSERLKGRGEAENQQVYVFSDFQKNQVDLEKLVKDSPVDYNLVLLEGNKSNNLLIDSLWFEESVTSINKPYSLSIKIQNEGEEEVINSNVNVLINDQQKSVASFNVAGKSSTVVNTGLTFEEYGIHNCMIKIEDASIKYDNEMNFTIQIQEKLKVLELFGEKSSVEMKRLISIVDAFELDQINIKTLSYDVLSSYEIIFLRDFADLSSGLLVELIKFVENGGDICIIPKENEDSDGLASIINNFILLDIEGEFDNKQKVQELNISNPFFNDVFNEKKDGQKWLLPYFENFYFVSNTKGSTSLLSLENGAPLLLHNTKFGGNQYFFTSSIDSTNSDFLKNGLFVPVFLKMIINSRIQNQPFYAIGKEDLINITDYIDVKSEDKFLLKSLKGEKEFIPAIMKKGRESFLDLAKMELEPGDYRLYQGNNEVFGFSLNLDRKESVQDYYSFEELENKLSELSNVNLIEGKSNDFESQISEIIEEKTYWHYLLALSLLFLIIETSLLRWFKV